MDADVLATQGARAPATMILYDYDASIVIFQTWKYMEPGLYTWQFSSKYIQLVVVMTKYLQLRQRQGLDSSYETVWFIKGAKLWSNF